MNTPKATTIGPKYMAEYKPTATKLQRGGGRWVEGGGAGGEGWGWVGGGGNTAN